MLWGISALLCWPFTKGTFNNKKWIYLLTLITPYIILGLSTLYTDDSKQMEFALTQKLSLWVMPLGFFATSTLQNTKKTILLALVFAASVITVLVYSNLMILINGMISIDGAYLASDYSTQYRMSLEHYSGIHPTYLALFIYFSIFSLLEASKQKLLISKSTTRNITYYTLSFVLFALSIPLSARWPLIVFIVVFIWHQLKQVKAMKMKVILFSIVGLIGISSYFLSDGIRGRFDEVFNTELKVPEGNNHNSTNVRVGIYNCAWILFKENWSTGVGIGDTQNELNKCYQQYDTDIYNEINFNTHNSIMNFAVTAGIFGVISLIIMYSTSFISYRRWAFPISFLALFILCSFTENLFDRQLGIVFFCLFNSLFVFTKLNEDNVNQQA